MPSANFRTKSHFQVRTSESPKKSRKESLAGCKKVPENTRKSRKNNPKSPRIWVFFRYFSTFAGIFGDFFADPPKDSFREEGEETPVNGRSGRNGNQEMRIEWPPQLVEG